MANSVPLTPTPRDPYLRFMKRLLEIHGGDDRCVKCDDPAPCDTMRAAWIYDLETHGPAGVSA